MKKLLLIFLFLVTSVQAQWFTDTVGGNTAATNLYDIINFNPSGQNITASSTAILFSDSVETTDHYTFAEITTPTPEANKGKLYTKTNDKIFFQDGAGVEHEITGNTGTAADDITALTNYGLDDSVGSSALTINLVLKNGSSTPTGGDTVDIAFRNSTITNGGYVLRSVAAALSLVVPSTATLGTASAVENDIYVYAIDNAGTVELAVSLTPFLDETILYSTTALSTGSDSNIVLYSTTARSNVPLRFLGTLTNTQATAGTWASVADSIQTGFKIVPPVCYIKQVETAGTGGGTCTESAGFQIRSLNTLEGGKDCQFLILDTGADDWDQAIGGYEFDIVAEGHNLNEHVAKLRNTTDSTDIVGTSQRANVAADGNASHISGSATITAIKTYRIEHDCTASRSSDGFGRATNGSVVEVFMIAKIRKVK